MFRETLLRLEVRAYRILAGFHNSWQHHTADVISFWAGLFWAYALLPDPTPVAGPHILMASFAPLWVWGVAAALVSAVNWCGLHNQNLIPRHIALSLTAGFWLSIALIFWLSGVSLTGKGIYTIIFWTLIWFAWLGALIFMPLSRWRARLARMGVTDVS